MTSHFPGTSCSLDVNARRWHQEPGAEHPVVRGRLFILPRLPTPGRLRWHRTGHSKIRYIDQRRVSRQVRQQEIEEHAIQIRTDRIEPPRGVPVVLLHGTRRG